MEPSYTLEYYDRIFGRRGPEFWELVEALEDQLEDYARVLPQVLETGDPEALAKLRHAHRPMVENLGLAGLQGLEREIRAALETGDPEGRLAGLTARFTSHAGTLARSLASERSQT